MNGMSQSLEWYGKIARNIDRIYQEVRNPQLTEQERSDLILENDDFFMEAEAFSEALRLNQLPQHYKTLWGVIEDQMVEIYEIVLRKVA